MASEGTRTETSDVEELLRHAYARIREHDLSGAGKIIEDALSVDFDNIEVVTALKYVNFWRDRIARLDGILNPFEKGEYLLSQWGLFVGFVGRVGRLADNCLYAVRQHVFGEALAHFSELVKDVEPDDPELLLRIGRCYKGRGEFDKALGYLESAARERRDDAQILSELADCYEMVNETQKSKAFFREAFFLDPQKVDLTSLESKMLERLAEAVAEQGHTGPLLKEWIPVYGVLYGVFTVKRELRSIELGKLKQAIYQLEREYGDSGNTDQAIEARLINRYFWLIDHYVGANEDTGKLDEVLLKLRAVNPTVYRKYVN